MAVQWPLILFTTLLAASAGLFATQGVYALAGKGQKAQAPSLATSAVLLVIGGISVFFHLEHWERIFNGFGNPTSGITQELIAIVLMALVMVVAFVMIRKNALPTKWCSILMIGISAVLVLVMGLSYMMAAHPTWNSIFQVLSLYGIGVAAGAGIFAFIDSKTESDDNSLTETITLYGTIINIVCTLAFIISMVIAASSMASVGNYFDPNHPTAGMVSGQTYSPFAMGAMGYTIGAIIAAAAAVGFAFYGRKSKKWKVAGIGIACCAIIGGLLLRAVFFLSGGSVFMFF